MRSSYRELIEQRGNSRRCTARGVSATRGLDDDRRSARRASTRWPTDYVDGDPAPRQPNGPVPARRLVDRWHHGVRGRRTVGVASARRSRLRRLVRHPNCPPSTTRYRPRRLGAAFLYDDVVDFAARFSGRTLDIRMSVRPAAAALTGGAAVRRGRLLEEAKRASGMVGEAADVEEAYVRRVGRRWRRGVGASVRRGYAPNRLAAPASHFFATRPTEGALREIDADQRRKRPTADGPTRLASRSHVHRSSW